MFNNLKLKNKLLLSFFLITCISTVVTTIFSIYYFSDVIRYEAVNNMRKNVQVADLIYNRKISDVHMLTDTLANDGTFQVLAQFTIGSKLDQYLQGIGERESIHEIVLFDKGGRIIGHFNKPGYRTTDQQNMNSKLLKQVQNEKISLAGTELLKGEQRGQDLLAIAAIAPVIRRKIVSNARKPEAVAVESNAQIIGFVLIRYIQSNHDELIAEIQNLLGVTAAVFYEAQAVGFRSEPFVDVPTISRAAYDQMAQGKIAEYELVEMSLGGQLAEYRILYDTAKLPVAVLSVSISADSYVESIRRAIFTLLGIMLVCIVLASILGYLLARSILIPIYKLLNGVKRVTSGDLSHEIIMDFKDELGILALSFNSMAKQLQELFGTLEQRIENATHKLQNTLAHMTAIIDNMADGLLVTDVEGRIIRYNPALSAMYPSEKNMLNRHCMDVLSHDIAELVNKAQKMTEEVYSAEVLLFNQRIGKAVATAILQKDTTDDQTQAYTGSHYIGSVILIRDITHEKEIDQILKNTVDTLTRVGTALSAETNLRKLLDLFVSEARSLTGADAGTLYSVFQDHLNFEIVHNKSLNLFIGSTVNEPANFDPIPIEADLFAARCARYKQVIHNISRPEPAYKASSRFVSSSSMSEYHIDEMLLVPMLDRMKNTVGVLQLLNPKEPKTDAPTSFTNNQMEIVNSLASQAAVAIDNARNYEKIERKNIAFQRFVPTEFLSYLGKEEVEDIRLGEAMKESMSVLFADIRSFTTLSENMTPERNFHFLNDYLSHVGPSITSNGGFVDKYIGDAVMALFPGTHFSIADDAVAAATGMMEQLHVFNQQRLAAQALPINIGIGIHSGPLILGTIGFETRMESTVIGDTVNLASRVESLTKHYGINIGITATTLQQLKQPERFMIRELDTVQVKGKEEAITVYEVFNTDPEPLREQKQQMLTDYYAALALYKARQWADALHQFHALVDHGNLQDQVLSIYLERCQRFITEPPEESWLGVTRLEEK